MTLRSYRPIRKVGKHAFAPPTRPLPPGRCTWCGVWMVSLDRDHVLPRSLFPGANRDAPMNLVASCRSCNRKRADGKLRPSFERLPKRSQAFALGWFTPTRLAKHFVDVPE